MIQGPFPPIKCGMDEWQQIVMKQQRPSMGSVSDVESALLTSSSEDESEDEVFLIPIDPEESVPHAPEEEATPASTKKAAELEAKSLADTRNQLIKLVKYVKVGNQTATVIALCSLLEFDLDKDPCQIQLVKDAGAIEVLLNILETDDFRCKVGALMVLRKMKSRKAIRKAKAIPRLIDMMDAPEEVLHGTGSHHKIDNAGYLDEVRTATQALLALMESRTNREILLKSGGIFVLLKLLETTKKEILIPTVAVVQRCAVETNSMTMTTNSSPDDFRLALRSGGMVIQLVRLLNSSSDPALLEQCGFAIARAAEDAETRDLVRQHGGLETLVKLLDKQENTQLLIAVTQALWKCSVSPKNLERIQEVKGVKEVVSLLHHHSETVLINVVGALAEIATVEQNRYYSIGARPDKKTKTRTIFKLDGIKCLVNMLTRSHIPLLVNVAKALGACAQTQEITDTIIELDGVRLLWSLLRNSDPEVQAASSCAIRQCLETRGLNNGATGELVRSLVGGLELLVTRLQSKNDEVVAGICSAVSVIAEDEENLAVLTDHGIVPILAQLTRAQPKGDVLRHYLARAITQCSRFGANRTTFGEHAAVAPLVAFFTTSTDPKVHCAVTTALEQLSLHPSNCIVMHRQGVVSHLLKLCGTSDRRVQDAAANCLQHIRRVTRLHSRAARKSRKTRLK
ncbi:unnamed protein product [Cyprideis torosa]|uniref:Uncharacterized protein n=1 Tax=Cyprideis torosa TaxID=163714 RepID=A0A7R8ZK09_9CRUS|nr:unnamed protein product [Cyprideis torosa]CAG0883458.1 unnamed protein product [Cyprideis torosa]